MWVAQLGESDVGDFIRRTNEAADAKDAKGADDDDGVDGPEVTAGLPAATRLWSRVPRPRSRKRSEHVPSEG